MDQFVATGVESIISESAKKKMSGQIDWLSQFSCLRILVK